MDNDKELIRKALIIAFLPLIVIVFLFLPRPILRIVLPIFVTLVVLRACMGQVNVLRLLTTRKRSTGSVSQSDGHLYCDKLIYIDDNALTIRLYYFPFGSKRVNFSEIETVIGYKGCCMRLWGTGDFWTWFGCDWGRMRREMVFVIKRKGKWSRVGFTCQDCDAVIKILQSRGLYETR